MADIAINPVTRRVQFTGNTGTGPFAFTFNILADEDIAVYKNTTLLTLTTHYSVTTNANGTGSITLVAGQALISSDVLTIIGGRDLSRTTDFVTAGDLLASSLNEQLDSLVIMTQQLDEKVGRTIKTNPGDVYTDLELPTKDNRKGTVLGFNATSGDPEVGPTIADVSSLASITADIATLADIEDGTDATDAIQTVAGISSNVSTVAGISSNVTTVAGNTSNINAVAADATDIGTVAGSISNVNTVAGIDSNITTVAGNTTNINTVAGNNSNITTVAGVSANVTTVAGISSDVTTVAGISSDVTTVAADGTDIGTVATNIADVNTVASNIATISAKVSKSGDTMTGDLTIQGNLTVSGTTITVDSATAQTIDLGDGDRMRFGDSNDAYIEWNGTYFDARSTGRFDLLSSGNDLRLSTATNVGLIVNHTGGTPAVQLYNSGVERLATTSTGVDITGTLTSDGLTVDGNAAIQNTSDGFRTLSLSGNRSNSGVTTARLSMQWDGNEIARIQSHGGADTTNKDEGDLLFYTADAGSLKIRQLIKQNGDISFYEDTGTTAKFFWDASGESLGIGTTSPIGGSLHLAKSGTSDYTNMFFQNTGASGRNYQLGVGGSNTGNYAGKFYIYDSTAGQPRFSLDSSGNVGIGTLSPDAPLVVEESAVSQTAQGNDFAVFKRNADGYLKIYNGNTNIGGIAFGDPDDPFIGAIRYAHSTDSLDFYVNNAERMRIDSSGNLLLGSATYGGYGPLQVGSTSTASTVIQMLSATNGYNTIHFGDATSGTGRYAGYIQYDNNTNAMLLATGSTERMRIKSDGDVLINKVGAKLFFQNSLGAAPYIQNAGTNNSDLTISTGGSERMRIDSSGNVGIGTSSPSSFAANASNLVVGSGSGTEGITVYSGSSNYGVIYFADGTSGASAYAGNINYNHADNSMRLGTNGSTTDVVIDSSGNVGIGTTSPEYNFQLSNTAGDANLGITASASGLSQVLFTDGSIAGKVAYRHATNSMEFTTNGSEAMRIDSSGNLLVGKTVTTFGTDGHVLWEDGLVDFSRTAISTTMRVNKNTHDGDLISFSKDGTTVGSIGTSNSYIYIGEGDVGLAFRGASDYILPWNPSTNSTRDNAIDIGDISYRFDDIYATNGTIQTSDRNEKQDIAELSDAEQRVAVAAKALLRKFRWRDAVEEKGDEARTHFGIIAQDLQAAFAAEGLDAGDYAMFIHSTWTDEETGEERTRMGVRYSELLAFIIAAI
jgi:hypothetical protein